jgi:Family of unknown function (DUF5681)
MAWKPGESGNPGGRRAAKPITDAIYMELAAAEDGREDAVPARSLRMAIRKQLEKASQGDLNALIFLTERTEGKARQVITGDDQQPIQITLERGEEARARIIAELNRIGSRMVEVEVVEASEQHKLQNS